MTLLKRERGEELRWLFPNGAWKPGVLLEVLWAQGLVVVREGNDTLCPLGLSQ